MVLFKEVMITLPLFVYLWNENVNMCLFLGLCLCFIIITVSECLIRIKVQGVDYVLLVMD